MQLAASPTAERWYPPSLRCLSTQTLQLEVPPLLDSYDLPRLREYEDNLYHNPRTHALAAYEQVMKGYAKHGKPEELYDVLA